MFFHPKNMKSENNNPWFDILLHTQSIVCARVDSQCLEYLRCTTLAVCIILSTGKVDFKLHWFIISNEIVISVLFTQHGFKKNKKWILIFKETPTNQNEFSSFIFCCFLVATTILFFIQIVEIRNSFFRKTIWWAVNLYLFHQMSTTNPESTKRVLSLKIVSLIRYKGPQIDVCL